MPQAAKETPGRAREICLFAKRPTRRRPQMPASDMLRIKRRPRTTMAACFQRHLPILTSSAILAGALLDAGSSKAVLYIDFIPVSPTITRVQASGSLSRSLLPTGTGNVLTNQSQATDSTSTNTSGINFDSDRILATYTPTAGSVTGTRWKITGSTNPFTGTGNIRWDSPPGAVGPTPSNNPLFFNRRNHTS